MLLFFCLLLTPEELRTQPAIYLPLHGCMIALLFICMAGFRWRKKSFTRSASRALVSCGLCKEDSAPRGFPQSVLVRIQVGLVWITAAAACEYKLVCTCEGVCRNGGLREVICSRFRLRVYSQTHVKTEGFD